MKQFQLYVRSGCHLCEAMEEELSVFIVAGKIQVERIYIDNDETLKKVYGERIPVLVYIDDPVCEYFLDPDKLQAILKPVINDKDD